jgi:alpha-tubulin suppressor-like RCC1 family protein
MSRRLNLGLRLLTIATLGITVCAAQTAGGVWGWGLNGAGQLGNGTATDSATPVQVLNLSAVISVAAGSGHTLAVKSDGPVWSWRQSLRRVGIGSVSTCVFGMICPPDAPASIQVPNISGATAVAAGSNFSLALKSDGSVWTWGLSTWGQLGNGNTDNSTVPVQVLNLSGVVAIAASYGHSLALNPTGRYGHGGTTRSAVWATGPPATGAFSSRSSTLQALSRSQRARITASHSNPMAQCGGGATTSTGSSRLEPSRRRRARLSKPRT